MRRRTLLVLAAVAGLLAPTAPAAACASTRTRTAWWSSLSRLNAL